MREVFFITISIFLVFGITSCQSPKTDTQPTDAQPQKMQFFEGKWADALIKAKQQNKLIFVDAYTDWCEPCKMLESQSFIDKEVISLYNQHFINIRLDMEKDEGIDFAKKYEIMAYPTLLFIDSQGKEKERTLGFQRPNQLIEIGKQVNENIHLQ